MIDIWGNKSEQWSSLIGKPYFKFPNIKCKNINCGKEERFKQLKSNTYLCECGYIIEGNLDGIKIAPKLYCSSKNCPESKSKMNIDCIKCQFIKER